MDDLAVRFCPECGTKVKARKAAFESPRACPSCSRQVFFWDYPLAPPPEFVVADGIPPVRFRFELFITISLAVLLSLCLVVGLLFVFGQITVAVILAFLCLCASVSAVLSLIVAIRHVKQLQVAIHTARVRFETAQKSIHPFAMRYAGYMRNHQAVLETEVQAVRDEQEAWRDKMASDRASAEKYLSEAKLVFETSAGSVRAIAIRFLKDTQKNIGDKLTTNNFALSKDRFHKAVEFCRKQGYDVPLSDIQAFEKELENDYQELLRKQMAREEQARIRERIREEQKVDQEIQRELERTAREKQAIEKALADALARTKDLHSAEIELLQQKLAEAEAKSLRAISMAQQTKAGNVYVISNVGSFGEDVFKIGMTRRLEPLDRVKELGDASVPFPFDVHMMIACEDAPALEAKLHQKFFRNRVNRVNLRKEFFRVSLEQIKDAVFEERGEIAYTAEADAFEYRKASP